MISIGYRVPVFPVEYFDTIAQSAAMLVIVYNRPDSAMIRTARSAPNRRRVTVLFLHICIIMAAEITFNMVI